MVSVLLPVRDAVGTLDQAMSCLVNQTLTDLEIVAVDDGSTDGSGERLEAWAARDGRVRVLRRPALGLVAALNEGLRACRGPLVARMDADDLCHPERLAEQQAFLSAHPEIGVAGTLVDAVTIAGEAVGRGMTRYLAWSNALVEPADIARQRFIESPLVHPSVMMRRALVADGYRDGDFPEDYELWLRLSARGVALAKVPRVLVTWREHSDRATRRDPRYAPAAHRALKLDALLAGPLAGGGPVLLWGAGLEGKPFLRALRARGRAVPAVIDIDPRKLGNVVHGARVVPPAELPGLRAAHPGAVLLVAVGVPEARPGLRVDLAGLVEGADYFFIV
jgi:glycosyltransferase involved in cell wall biosynthesis